MPGRLGYGHLWESLSCLAPHFILLCIACEMDRKRYNMQTLTLMMTANNLYIRQSRLKGEGIVGNKEKLFKITKTRISQKITMLPNG